MRYILTVVCGVILLTSFACREKGTEPHPSTIQLTAEDVGVTDVWLKLTVANATEYDSIIVVRDGQPIYSTRPTTNYLRLDTIILDENLLPKHNYTYQLSRYKGRFFFEHTSELKITTMDTTSHNFTWEIDTLGDGSSSVLRDVAIINDTTVVAVGEINVKDSLGNWINPPYNMAQWNGKEWKLTRVMYNYQGRDYYSDLYSVFAFGENDYWLSSNQPMHWNRSKWETFDLPATVWNGWIYKMWGTSSNNFYIVGMGGNIAHYDGSTWRKMNSGTTLDIQDIWGSMNNKTGELEIIAAAGNYYVSNDRKILSISGTTVTILSDSGINWALNGIWFSPGKYYWVVGDGIWNKRFTLKSTRWEQQYVSTYTTNRIRGTDINDIFLCGKYLFHFNGSSWQSFSSLTALSVGQYLSIAVRGNTVFAVGYQYPRAVVARGRLLVTVSRKEVTR